jgi:hypothetical protein
MIPPAPMPPEEGSLSERLTTVVQAWAESMAEAPAALSAISWLSLGGGMDQLPSERARVTRESVELRTLRERIAQQYSAPFDAVLDSPQAKAELGEVDREQAIALLIGPILLGKLSTLADFDYRECARAAVAGFLATHAKSDARS